MGTETRAYEALREAEEFREQLASERRRLVFLLGAGTSQAVGIDGLAALTAKVPTQLQERFRAHYERLLNELGQDATLEGVLDRVRLCRELIGGGDNAEAGGMRGQEAAQLDRAICHAVYELVKVDPPKGLNPHVTLATWINSISRDYPVEIFTTNYDLLMERALEAAEIPHFDGFVGTVNPHFAPATLERDSIGEADRVAPARGWVRVWKLHGSIGWRTARDPISGNQRIIRVPVLEPTEGDDLIIFPTREKYAASRKLPFVAYHDRLRRVLSSGEVLLVISGYSFGDQHINEMIFQSLRTNNRLAATALLYSSIREQPICDALVRPSEGIRNLTLYAPDGASVGGMIGNWSRPEQEPPASLGMWPFWNDEKNEFALGDFSAFANYLNAFLGIRKSHLVSSSESA